jgi:hypothetical protein
VAILAMTILAILFLARRAGRRRMERLPAGAAADAPGQELLPDEALPDEFLPDRFPPAGQEPPA